MGEDQIGTDLIHPVILCGGSGTRLWPLSRESFPKQFVQLFGPEDSNSLFQKTVMRFSDPAFASPTVLANNAFRFVASDQLSALGVEPDRLIIEPAIRNTAPAILAAAMYLEARNPDAVMLVAPSDHIVPDADAFVATVLAARDAAPEGAMVTFGIAPDRPETGYGYLETDVSDTRETLSPVARFVEKPELARATEMVESGNYLWNAGIFMMSARTAIEAYRNLAPDIYRQVRLAIDTAKSDLQFLRLDAEAYAAAPNISIDYAIMEKSDALYAAPSEFEWNDLGAWDAVYKASKRDKHGNVVIGEVTAIDCANSMLRSDSDRLDLVGIGLEDMIVVAQGDAVLIAPASEAQKVKDAVAELKKRDRPAAVRFPRDYRPWGWYESIASGDRFQVKRIVVEPGASLSLQSHHHRAEHWIVVQGTALVTIGELKKTVTENQSVYIPLGEIHRLENPGKLPVVLIEVQTGAYLGEDDIVRYEDKYSRND